MIQITDTCSPLSPVGDIPPHWGNPPASPSPLLRGTTGGSNCKAGISDFVNFIGSDNLLHGARFAPYNPSLLDRARKMRKEMTLAEKIMWKEILPWLTKHRFLRQRPIHHYIADFYCPKLKIVIEVDWDSHNSEEAQEYDKTRTRILGNYGIEVIRYKNEDVILHTQKVIKDLREKLHIMEQMLQ